MKFGCEFFPLDFLTAAPPPSFRKTTFRKIKKILVFARIFSN
jgi:hypothetical protein